jgi:deoxycytidylate deaminase
MSNPINADTIILGFTGSIGSGCTYIAKGLAEHYHFPYFSLSDVLKDIATRNGLTNPSPKELQDLGNKLRSESRKNSHLVEELFKRIESSPPQGDSPGVIIIDSIRNDGEVKTLKQFPYFYLFSIHANEDLRLKRTLKMKKFKDEAEFHAADMRDREEEVHYGQQVKKCNYLSDIIINNEENIPENAEVKKRELLQDIYNDYFVLIKNNKDGKTDPENPPSVDETLMTIAYAESQRSSCLKRKVGAIVATVQTIASKDKHDQSIRDSVNIISSGHNEVPLGTTACVFTEHGKCYRDYLQESQASKIKCCPSCGAAIKISFTCPNCQSKIDTFLKNCPNCKKEISVKYDCPQCHINVYSEYLLSGGKLLDMCRALHAEENALIHLTKMGSNNQPGLTLYTTTYPCNMCANKIVASGIKNIVYADPYPMKEAKDILAAANVESVKFQGIKSSAYFRLYNQ